MSRVICFSRLRLWRPVICPLEISIVSCLHSHLSSRRPPKVSAKSIGDVSVVFFFLLSSFFLRRKWKIGNGLARVTRPSRQNASVFSDHRNRIGPRFLFCFVFSCRCCSVLSFFAPLFLRPLWFFIGRASCFQNTSYDSLKPYLTRLNHMKPNQSQTR